MMLSVPSVTMNGGICNRVTSAPLRKPKATPHSSPSGKAKTIGTPSMTASRPITTDEITMITPTERSMPAVRITNVCAMPRMPMIVTWVSTVDRLLPVTKCEKLTRHAEQKAQHQHDEGNDGRIGVQEALHALDERKMLFFE